MKHLTTLPLTLLVSGSLLADKSIEEQFKEAKNNKAMAVNIETGEKFFVSRVKVWYGNNLADKGMRKAQVLAVQKCDENFNIKQLLNNNFHYSYELVGTPEFYNSVCQVFQVNDEIFHNDIAEYKRAMKAFEGAEITQESEIQIKLAEEERQRREQEEQKEIVLVALFDRCVNFGWEGEKEISACIKQEAYRDLLLQEQEYKLKELEMKIASAKPSKEKPLFLEILSLYAEAQEEEQLNAMQNDIAVLKRQNRSLSNVNRTKILLKKIYNN